MSGKSNYFKEEIQTIVSVAPSRIRDEEETIETLSEETCWDVPSASTISRYSINLFEKIFIKKMQGNKEQIRIKPVNNFFLLRCTLRSDGNSKERSLNQNFIDIRRNRGR